MKVMIGGFGTQEKNLAILFVPAEERTQGFVHATQALYYPATSPATAHLIKLKKKKDEFYFMSVLPTCMYVHDGG